MKSDQIEKARQVKALGSPDPKNPRYLWLERNGKRGYFIPNKEEAQQYSSQGGGAALSSKRTKDRANQRRASSSGAHYTKDIGDRTKDWRKEVIKELTKSQSDELGTTTQHTFEKGGDDYDIAEQIRYQRACVDGVDYTVDEEYDLEKAESILLGIDPEEEIVKAQFSELELAEDLLLK